MKASVAPLRFWVMVLLQTFASSPVCLYNFISLSLVTIMKGNHRQHIQNLPCKAAEISCTNVRKYPGPCTLNSVPLHIRITRVCDHVIKNYWLGRTLAYSLCRIRYRTAKERECLLVVKALVRDVGELDPNPGAVTGFLCDAGQSQSPCSHRGCWTPVSAARLH